MLPSSFQQSRLRAPGRAGSPTLPVAQHRQSSAKLPRSAPGTGWCGAVDSHGTAARSRLRCKFAGRTHLAPAMGGAVTKGATLPIRRALPEVESCWRMWQASHSTCEVWLEEPTESRMEGGRTAAWVRLQI